VISLDQVKQRCLTSQV